MKATGTFEITLDPRADETAPAGRVMIDKTYSGDLLGTGIGQMISKRLDDGLHKYVLTYEF